MGGRGGSSGLTNGGSADGTIVGGPKRTIESRYIEGRGFQRGYYTDTVLEATTDGAGNVSFDYTKPVEWNKTAKTNKTNYITYEVQAGAVNGKMFNVNLGKATTVSGQTYGIKDSLKEAGFKWNGARKRWEK